MLQHFLNHRTAAASKTKDYRNVVIIQSLIVGAALLLADVLQLVNMLNSRQIYFTAYLILSTTYFYLLWDLAKNFLRRRTVIGFMFCWLVVLFVLMVLVENPFVDVIQHKVTWLLIIHSGLFAMEAGFIALTFHDVFSSESVTKNNLWGAVALFLMITISFASLYDIINMLQPTSFGLLLEAGFPAYTESLYCSLVAVTGGFPAFTGVSHLIRNLVTIEGFAGTLFLVILIGRILGKVKAE